MIGSKKLSDLVCNIEKKFNSSRKQIANDIGISRDMIYKLMGTDRNPSAENLQKIANYFKLTTDYLLKSDEKDPAHATDIKNFASNNTILIGSNNQVGNSTRVPSTTKKPNFCSSTVRSPRPSRILSSFLLKP